MFRTLQITSSLIKTTNKFQNFRNLYWIHNSNGVYSLGIDKNIIKYNKINQIEVNQNRYNNFGDLLFSVETDKSIKYIKAPFNCEIIDENYEIMKHLNKKTVSKNKSWIIKITPLNLKRHVIYFYPSVAEYCIDIRTNDSIPEYAMYYK